MSEPNSTQLQNSTLPRVSGGKETISIKIRDDDGKDLLPDMTKLAGLLVDVKTLDGKDYATTLITDKSTSQIPLDIHTFKSSLKNYIKSNFLDYVDDKQALLDSYMNDMQNSSIASQMGTSSQLVLFKDPDDKYLFFSNIESSSTSQMNNKLKDINMISSFVNLGKSKDERLKKYFYLLHSVNSVGLTTLQWACFHNRVDIVMLILSYLVGGDKEYVRKYINYYNYNNDKQNALYSGRAYDMIGRSNNIGAYTSAVQAIKSTGSILGNVLSFNLKTALTDIFRKTKNVITASGQVPLDNILLAFGSIKDEHSNAIELINKNVDIQPMYNDRLMLSVIDQNLSMGISHVYQNAQKTGKIRGGKKRRNKTIRKFKTRR